MCVTTGRSHAARPPRQSVHHPQGHRTGPVTTCDRRTAIHYTNANIYYGYIAKWCSGIACNWCVSLDIGLMLALIQSDTHTRGVMGRHGSHIALSQLPPRTDKQPYTTQHHMRAHVQTIIASRENMAFIHFYQTYSVTSINISCLTIHNIFLKNCTGIQISRKKEQTNISWMT